MVGCAGSGCLFWVFDLFLVGVLGKSFSGFCGLGGVLGYSDCLCLQLIAIMYSSCISCYNYHCSRINFVN